MIGGNVVILDPPTVVDTGFQRRGRQPPRWGANLLFGQIFPENCMKIKEFGPGGRVPGAPPPLRSANASILLLAFSIVHLTACKIIFPGNYVCPSAIDTHTN